MYQVGDLIIYGNSGVCKVTDITNQNLTGTENEQTFYVLKPLFQNCTISTPVNTTKVFMRPIISTDEANRLIDTIPSVQPEMSNISDLRQLTAHYEAYFQTHDCADLIELSMSIYEKKQMLKEQKRKFGTIDERYMKRAEDLLFGEFSAALGIQKEDVPAYIDSRINSVMRE